MRQRYFLSVGSLLVASLLLMTACGEEPAETAELTVTAGPLQPGSAFIWFNFATDSHLYATDGSTSGVPGSVSSTSWTGTARMTVPEGRICFGAVAWRASGVSSLPTVDQVYTVTDTCSLPDPPVTVQSGIRTRVALQCTPVAMPAASSTPLDMGDGAVGLDRLVINADYEFDQFHPYAGSIDGSNIARVVVDLTDRAGTVPVAGASVFVADVVSPARFGCFETLPDVWPDPSTWGTTGTCDDNLDSAGLWTGYLVVQPGYDVQSSSLSGTVRIGNTDDYPWMARHANFARVEVLAQ